MKKMKDPMEKMKEKVGFKESGIVQLSYAATKLENNIGLPDIDGQGVQIDFGSRTYFNRTSWKGLYLQNCLTAGKIWFKDDIPASAFTTAQHVSGFYNYISIFNPDFGYKLATAGGFSAEAAIGCIWKWELKGKADDIDNRMFDNFNPRVGVKLGYQF